jgi:hypothetical protein
MSRGTRRGRTKDEREEEILTEEEMVIISELRPMASMPLQRRRQMFSMVSDDLALELAAEHNLT